MGQETFGKKEREKKKQKKKQDKEEKKTERKNNNDKGKSLDDMMVYIDENGNFTDTPPDPKKKREIDASSIQIGIPKLEDREVVSAVRKGVVKFFDTAKGYGFINDIATNESVFVHMNNLSAPVNQGDKVTFEIEHTQRGLSAIKVAKAGQ
jgi:cold shock CspA family protein